MHNPRRLDVYAKGLNVVGEVYKLSKRFPKEELFGLTSQLRRAVTSIVLNIAGESGCDSDREFLKVLG